PDFDLAHGSSRSPSPTRLQLAWTSDRLVCLLVTRAHNTEHVQQLGVQRGGYHHPRTDTQGAAHTTMAFLPSPACARVGETVANSPAVAVPALQRSHSAAKPRAPVLTDCNVPSTLAITTRVQKRSYARFLRRLTTYGKAVYKGRTYSRPLGPAPAAESHATSQDSGPTHGAAPPSHRWRIVSWNAGGLSQPKLDELFLWLQMEEQQGRPVHVMTIQETHWSFTSEWQSQGHWLIHSSLEKPARSAGILQILRQDFVSSQQIKNSTCDPRPTGPHPPGHGAADIAHYCVSTLLVHQLGPHSYPGQAPRGQRAVLDPTSPIDLWVTLPSVTNW
ncbi:unnamed protein product, partial [Symbiodinium microadriaticum]